MLYIDVILPLPLSQQFTYSVPNELSPLIQTGVRVIVPFGVRKFYSAIVENICDRNVATCPMKEIVSVLDGSPVVNTLQIQLWRWIASYYMCTVGEVMKVAVPSGLKLASETKVFYNGDYVQCDELNPHEEEVLHLVCEKKCLAVSDIAACCKFRDLMRTVQSLVNKEALRVEEVIAGRYKPKIEVCVRLHADMETEAQLQNTFNILARAPKQLDILINFVHLSHTFSGRPHREVTRKELLQAGSAQPEALNALVRKGILELYTKEVSRLENSDAASNSLPVLTPPQQTAIHQIREAFTAKDVVLLHGVTSSGKTEIYIRLIEEQIRQGKQVLYMLPEIALTAQIINRLKAVFGNRAGICHSKFSDAERVEVWNSVNSTDGYSVILGVRSSIFLPFARLGLIIVDEEHENTYKQFDPAPRYHARDAAIMLAACHGAKVLLGTATPSIESYRNAHEGKYALVELTQRYADMELPEVRIVNTAQARKQKKMHAHFHPDLLTAIGNTLKAGKQIILFQNRRGFAPLVQCRLCEYIPRCEHCDVSLTYHRFTDRLVCHYCGYSTERIHQCPACGSMEIGDIGFGTEKIEEDLQTFFPHAQTARLDLDSSRSRSNYEKIITDFEQRKTDILVGTQMITKGLDFANVHLAAVLDATGMLGYPDFRAYERAYQLITQVSGRAGRTGERGLVIIQTAQPLHPILQFIISGNYTGMYHTQMAERQRFSYPPLCRLIRITLKHKDRNTVHLAARELAARLTQIFGKRILGPQPPVISRIQNYCLENILLKIERQASPQKAKDLLAGAITSFKLQTAHKSTRTVIDVDPM